jgi:S1-C subfamily serine protease
MKYPMSASAGRRGYNVTFGIMPDFAGAEERGLRVDGIRKGGPAEKAGMLKGDIIIAIDGKKIKKYLRLYAPA